MKRLLFPTLCCLLYIGLHAQDNTDLTQYVDPFIGTQADGSIFPGATHPFGMVKLGPDCDDLNNNPGYKATGKVKGFSHLHVSGTGGGAKYGNILVYPFMGEVPDTGYGSTRGKETAKVGQFIMELKDSHITAELTTTPKTGIHSYTFQQAGKAGILIDAGSFLGAAGCCWEQQELVGSEIEIISNTEMAGSNRVRGGWNMSPPYPVYFYAVFNTPAMSYGTWKSGEKHPNNKAEFDSDQPVGAWFAYNMTAGHAIEVRVGISFISIGKAKENLMKEAAGLSFEQAVKNTRTAWNDYLQRIVVQTDNITEKVKFYTALYHTMMQPTDRTGENPSWINTLPYFDDYYAIWDTYRTNHPLFGLILQKREAEIVNSLIDIYEHEGYMPDARSGNFNGRTQGGSNCDMVVAEAILKDLNGVDYNKAWEAMVKDAEVPPGGDERKEGRGGLQEYISLGYVSTNKERAGTRTVEYAANDWALAQCASKLGKKAEYEKYRKRASNWENLWKPVESEGAKGFIMPRKANGEWDENYLKVNWKYYTDVAPRQVGITPMDQLKPEYMSKDKFTVLTGGSWPSFFYESQSWEYSLYVPQDVKQLIIKCGGKDAFISRLDTFFKKDYYNISNEPGFLAPCLYIYAGRQDKTASLVNNLLKKYYTEKPEGIPGNDDSGAMSSWYAFHNMGFFPNAGSPVYLITTPHFKKVTLTLGKGTQLTITTENLSTKNIYIKSAELNGKPLDRAWFSHSEIKNGGTLKFVMTDTPTGWGSSNIPPSRSDQ